MECGGKSSEAINLSSNISTINSPFVNHAASLGISFCVNISNGCCSIETPTVRVGITVRRAEAQKWKWLECPFGEVEISSTIFKKSLLVVELCTIQRLTLIRRRKTEIKRDETRIRKASPSFATAAASTNTNKAFEGLGSRKRERIPTVARRTIGIGFETSLVRSLGRNVYFKKKMIVVKFLRSKNRRW